jgi:excisionase family DNA binding protein
MRSHVKNAMPNTESTSRTSAAKVEDQSISTAQAARMLGMSTTMLQRLVDQNVFQAWKTPGGHRRIDLDSVLDYQKRIQKNPLEKEKKSELPIIKVIVDGGSDYKKIMNEMKCWVGYFNISFWSSVPEAFLSFSAQLPDVLIVQTSAPLNDQVSNVLALDKFLKNTEKPFSVVYLSENPDLKVAVEKSIHESIQILNSLLSHEWLNVFMSGAYAVTSLASVRNKK